MQTLTTAVKLQKNEEASIVLYNQEEIVYSLFAALKPFCIISGFDREYKTLSLLGQGSFGKVENLLPIS
jgi:hypothetical protein